MHEKRISGSPVKFGKSAKLAKPFTSALGALDMVESAEAHSLVLEGQSFEPVALLP